MFWKIKENFLISKSIGLFESNKDITNAALWGLINFQNKSGLGFTYLLYKVETWYFLEIIDLLITLLFFFFSIKIIWSKLALSGVIFHFRCNIKI